MMQKVSCTGKEAADLVKKFGNKVIRFHIIHHMYKELFEDEDAQILMENTANSFFGDLNTILQHYILLEFAKITDPATTRGHENFTIENLIESIDWPQDVRDTLISLNDKTKKFRGYIIEARNKLLAHMDKEVHLTNKVLGGFPKGEEETFLQTLVEICETTHKACFNSNFGKIVVTEEGDVHDLKKTLKSALAFEKKFYDSTGKEKSDLFSLVRGDVRRLIQEVMNERVHRQQNLLCT
jgi:hypothetical protein